MVVAYTTYAYSLLAMLEVVHSFTPYCSIETNEISSCSISEIEDDLLFFPASEFVLNRSYVNVTLGYINATFSFSTYKETVWELLVYVNKEVESIWIIQSLDCSKQVSPKGTVHLHFLPVSDNFSHLTLKILKQETDVLCRDSMYSEVCSNLSYAFLVLQSHALHNTLLLTMNVTRQVNLTIELMQGSCIVDCSGKPNPCDVLIEKFHWLMDDQNAFKFENKEPGFYCVRIYPEYSCMGNDCCTFATNATYLLGENIKSIPHELLPDSAMSPTNIILVILCLTMAIVLFACFLKIISIQRISRDVECLTADGALFRSRNSPTYTTLDVQRYSPLLTSSSIHSGLKSVEAFLLYSRQSEEFLQQMNDFRKRLEEDRIVVYDFNCLELEDQISRDSVAWVEKVLNNDNMKYILIEHREAVLRYKDLIENTKLATADYREPHHLDHLFLYALSSILNKFVENKCIAHDYRRLFIINFQDANEMGYKYTNLVPFKRYCLNDDRDADHYRQLIQDIYLEVCSSESIL